jgi:hypothetical protein
MTFDELKRKLPNGFHDAAIRNISVDFACKSIVLGMDLHVGESNDPDPERYRSGTLKVISPYLFFMEPPDPRYNFLLNGSSLNASDISMKLGESAELDSLLRRLPAGASTFGFFLDDWNSYVYLAGASVELSWDDET